MGKLRQGPLRPGSLWYPHDSAAKSVSTSFPQEARRLILQTPLPRGRAADGRLGRSWALLVPALSPLRSKGHRLGARWKGLGPDSAVWPWAGHCPSLSLSFPLGKGGITTPLGVFVFLSRKHRPDLWSSSSPSPGSGHMGLLCALWTPKSLSTSGPLHAQSHLPKMSFLQISA